VANFLAALRKWMSVPFVPRMDDVEAFLANTLIKAIPVAATEPALEEQL
jgi:hypothetical protein